MELFYYRAFEEYIEQFNNDKTCVQNYTNNWVSLEDVIRCMIGENDVNKFINHLHDHCVPHGLIIRQLKDGDKIISYHHALLIICSSGTHKAVESAKMIYEIVHKNQPVSKNLSDFIIIDERIGFIGKESFFVYPQNEGIYGPGCWISIESVRSMLGYKQEVKEIVRSHFKDKNTDLVSNFGTLVREKYIEAPDYEKMFKRSFNDNLMDGAFIPKMHDLTKMVNLSGLIYLTISSNIPKAKEYSRWIINQVVPQLIMRGQVTLDDFKLDYYVRPNEKETCKIIAGNSPGLYVIKSHLFNHKYGQTTFGNERLKQHTAMYLNGYKKILSDYDSGKQSDYSDEDIAIARKIVKSEMMPFELLLFVEFESPSILERLVRDYVFINNLGASEIINGDNKAEFFKPNDRFTIDRIIDDIIFLAGTKPSKSSKLISELEKTVNVLENLVGEMKDREKHCLEREQHYIEREKRYIEQLKTKDEQLKAKDEQLSDVNKKFDLKQIECDELKNQLIKFLMGQQPQLPIQQPQLPIQQRPVDLPLFHRDDINEVIKIFKDTKTQSVDNENTPVAIVHNRFCKWLSDNYKCEQEIPVKMIEFNRIFKQFYEIKSCSFPDKTKSKSFFSCRVSNL